MITRLSMRKLLLLTITIGLLATAAAPAQADLSETAEARYLAGLRERRLYSLVEAYCRRRLDEAYLVERRRAELTVELSRTALEAALFAKSPEREELAARAVKIIDDELRNKPSSAWRPLLDVQRGLVELVWGERLREEAQLLNAGEPQLEQARERLRSAVAQLKQARTSVEERLRESHRAKPGVNADVPDAEDWFSVRRNVDYQLGRAYRNQGESYPPRSPDRASSLEQAVETFESLTRAEQTDPITWQARLDEVTCKRLLGDLDSAEMILDLIDANAPPAEVADRARAQRIRVRIVANLLDEARKFLKPEDTDAASTVDADVRLAALEWLIAFGAAEEKAGRTQQATEIRARAAALTALIAERQAPYWARKAEALAASAVASTVTTSPAAVHADSSLTSAAASFYRQGNLDKAIEIYDQLFAQAWSKRQQEVAFDAAFTAGAIEQQRKQYAAAAGRYSKLAQTLAEHPRAAEAQLLAAYNVGQTLLAAKPDVLEAGLASYSQLLETQLKQWPSAKETAQARVWLGNLRMQQRAWDAAALAYSGVAPESPLALEAVRQLADCRLKQLAALRISGQPTGPMFVEVERELARYLPGYPQPTSIATPVARTAATALAKLGLLYGDEAFAPRAVVLLAEAARAVELPEVEAATIAVWRAAALVAAGHTEEAASIVAQSTNIPPSDAVAVVGLLDSAKPQAMPRHDAMLAEMVLKLAASVRQRSEPFVGPDALRVARAEARALNTLGRAAEARSAYDALLRNFPQDADARMAYAEFLARQTDRESLTLAAAKWREVERASPESSPRWYRARLGIVQAYADLGDKAKALQLIELTQALHPELGGPESKAKFDALFDRVKAAK